MIHSVRKVGWKTGNPWTSWLGWSYLAYNVSLQPHHIPACHYVLFASICYWMPCYSFFHFSPPLSFIHNFSSILICLKVESLYRGIWIGWIGGLRPTVQGSTRLNSGSYTWDTRISCNFTCWGKAVWWKETSGYWSVASWIWAISELRWPRRHPGL